MADHDFEPPGKKKGRARGGVDASLIVEEPRKRRRREGSTDNGLPSTRHGGRSGSPNPATVRARTEDEYQDVQRRGLQLYQKMMAQTDPHDRSRSLWHIFGELPDAAIFTDYYDLIKKPVSFNEVKSKLDRLEYACLKDVRDDISQIFVNAFRYNAKNSQVWLDAKRLRKCLKDHYSVMTGEAPPPDEDDLPVTSDPHGDISVGGSDGILLREGDIPGTKFAKRGATLKPWLTKKLAETMRAADMSGHSLIEYFRTLPDKRIYPDYYRVIGSPIAFDHIQAKVNKRGYKDVDEFKADVNLIFSNAMTYNEEESQIWQDAFAMRQHFAEVMLEVPPAFVPPRKYNMSKGGRGSSAHPENSDDEDQDGSEYGGGDGRSRSGSVVPLNLPYEPLLPAKQEEVADPFALANSGINTASPSLTPANGSPLLSHLGLAPIPETTNPLLDLAALAGYGLNGVEVETASSPGFGTNGASRPPSSRSDSNDGVYHPRLVAKLPAAGEIPLLSGFTVTSTPSSLSPIHLDNTHIRQHSFSVPFSTERVEFSPLFHSSSASSNGKGKEKANGDFHSNGNRNGSSNGYDGPRPVITIRAKPASLPFSLVKPSDVDNGTSSFSGEASYVLTPRKGLNVVEFVVRPAGAAEGEREEVYRCFVQR